MPSHACWPWGASRSASPRIALHVRADGEVQELAALPLAADNRLTIPMSGTGVRRWRATLANTV